MPGTVSLLGDVLVAPLFAESFAVPARTGAVDPLRNRAETEETDASIRGGFYSLFAFDARRLRLLWWDGDAGIRNSALDEEGASGRPVGAELVDEKAWQRIARAHVVGRPLQDGWRVYVPLATSGNEAQVWVAAYERRAGRFQPVVLVPSWLAFVTVVSQPAGVAPNPRLTLDPEGRIVVQTDVNVLAALDARTGAVEWVDRVEGSDQIVPRGRGMNRPIPHVACNDPPVVVPGDETRPAVAVLASREEGRWLGVSTQDGRVVWRSEPWVGITTGAMGREQPLDAPRVLALAHDVVLGYGGAGFVAFDGRTGAALLDPENAAHAVFQDDADGRARERPSGPAVAAGKNLYLIPTTSRAPGTNLRFLKTSLRRDKGRPVTLVLSLDASLVPTLDRVETATSLIPLPGRLVAVTAQRVVVYSWVKPGE